MPAGVREGTDEALARRLTWLTALRLVVLTAFLVVTATRFGGLNLGSFSGVVGLVIVGAAYVLAALYAVLLRARKNLSTVAYVQLTSDQLIWTALVYLTGGVHSGATSLYGLTSLSGAILLGVRGGVVAAVAGTVGFLVMSGGFALGVLYAPPDQPVDAYPHGSAVGIPIFVNLTVLFVVTALASWLGERLRMTGRQIERIEARAEEAERLAAAVGQLSAGLAHEIRNPLGAIAGSIELLRTSDALSLEDKQLCEIIQRETARVNDLVGDMLDLSRPRKPTRSPVDLCSTVRDVVTLAGRLGRGGDVRVHYDGPVVALVFADGAQLRQLVWNLVRNAIQASTAGSEVVLRVLDLRETAILEVIDQGPGIPPEARARMFDAFYSRSGGVGIGLAVVKRIVDDHGFMIEVESQEGHGTILRVRMPRYQPVSANVEVEEAEEATPMSRPSRISAG